MKIRKAIRKIVALGAGLSMVGATLLSASAADLKSYPTPFIKDGVFNGVIVFGDTAAASDVAGAVDIATNLQYLAKVETPITTSGGASVAVSGDAAKMRSGSDILEIGENLSAVKEIFTKDDLKALASGVLDNNQGSFSYNQYLKTRVNSSSAYEPVAYVDFAIDDDDDEDIPADYLYIKSGSDIFTYELEFQEAAESEITDSAGTATTAGTVLYDFEDEDLVLMGKTYAITKAYRGGKNQTKLTLMGGDVTDTLEEGQTKTYTINGKEYEVTALIIDDTTSTATVKMKVNGQVTRKMKEDQTDKVAGVEIGVRSLLGNEAGDVTQDLVEFYLGVDKIIIEDSDIIRSGGGTLQVAEETISDAKVEITGTDDTTKTKLSKIQIRVAADDDYYIGEGKKVTTQMDDPEGFFTRNFDIEFQGLSIPGSSEVKIQNAGDKQYNLQFTNKDGTEYKFPILSVISSGVNRVGDDSGTRDLILREGIVGQSALTYNIEDEDTFIINNNKPAGDRQTGFTHVLQYKSQDATNNVLKFKDLGSGETLEVSYTSPGQNDTGIVLGGTKFVIDIMSDVDNSNISVDLDGDGSITTSEQPWIVTKGGAYINVSVADRSGYDICNITSGNLVTVEVTVDADDIDDATEDETILANLSVDTTPRLDISTVAKKGTATLTPGYRSGYFLSGLHKVGTTDNRQERTVYGILIDQLVDTSGPDELTMTVPDKQAEALVYFTANTPTLTKTTSEGGALVSSTVAPIALGTAKLASEVDDVKAQNAIIVGGPCVNTAAATVLGNPTPCTKGFVEGKAMVKLVEQTNGNVAMIIAGYSALDTRRAARVVAEGTKLAELDAGVSEVEVAGTTLTEATVSVPTPVVEAPVAAPAAETTTEATA